MSSEITTTPRAHVVRRDRATTMNGAAARPAPGGPMHGLKEN